MVKQRTVMQRELSVIWLGTVLLVALTLSPVAFRLDWRSQAKDFRAQKQAA